MIFSNPFTTTVGAAGAVIGVLHALGVNLPFDAATVNSLLVFVLGLVAKDGTATKS